MGNHTFLEQVVAGSDDQLPWMLDLSLWYPWHSKMNTLPEEWAGFSQVEISHLLGSPAWIPVKPWKAIYEDVDVVVEEVGDERVVRYILPDRTLSASWTLGPDNDWWQVEHLIASPEDFDPAIDLAAALRYEVDEALVFDDELAGEGILRAIELPRRPLSALLHDFLGWGQGLLMLSDHEDEVGQLLGVLDMKMQALVKTLSDLPGSIMISPDNLDGQYISPDLFSRYLTQSYSESCLYAHAADKAFVVHVGGPMQHILAPLAAAGVDAVEGVSGPPQSDASLPEARRKAGEGLTLWGGIPQDLLLETTTADNFEAGVRSAAALAIEDGNAVLGVADRVPVAAERERLMRLGAVARSEIAGQA